MHFDKIGRTSFLLLDQRYNLFFFFFGFYLDHTKSPMSCNFVGALLYESLFIKWCTLCFNLKTFSGIANKICIWDLTLHPYYG